MTQGHIFVHDPMSSQKGCWICGLKKEEHPFTVEHKKVELDDSKLRNKSKVPATKKRQRVNVQS